MSVPKKVGNTIKALARSGGDFFYYLEAAVPADCSLREIRSMHRVREDLRQPSPEASEALGKKLGNDVADDWPGCRRSISAGAGCSSAAAHRATTPKLSCFDPPRHPRAATVAVINSSYQRLPPKAAKASSRRNKRANSKSNVFVRLTWAAYSSTGALMAFRDLRTAEIVHLALVARAISDGTRSSACLSSSAGSRPENGPSTSRRRKTIGARTQSLFRLRSRSCHSALSLLSGFPHVKPWPAIKE